MIRALIVDDHPIVRAGMRTVLEAAEDISVVAEGASGDDALRLVADYHPDVLILDVNLPDQNGLEVLQELCAQDSFPAVLILTAYDDSQTIFGLLECGAIGYVLKDEALETLVSAVRAAAKGESWLSPAVASQVLRRAVSKPNLNEIPPELSLQPDDYDDLTRREMEVLQLLAQGLDNTSIAEKLVVTKRTVQNHVSTIYSKLGVSSRPEAMLYAIRRGWSRVSPPDHTTNER
jgi:two-component system response regulator DegU